MISVVFIPKDILIFAKKFMHQASLDILFSIFQKKIQKSFWQAMPETLKAMEKCPFFFKTFKHPVKVRIHIFKSKKMDSIFM